MRRRSVGAFTIAEMLVSIAVLTLLVVLISRLFASATSVIGTASKRIDSDLQAREIFDRMGVDFTQMINRSDVDEYVKGPDAEVGNDKIAFFSQVPGYYPATGSQSPISLVAYRINANSTSSSFNKLERMGKGLLWNGVSPSDTPLIFGPADTLKNNWPTAIDTSAADPDYELVGPQVFRFEYYYVMKDGSFAVNPNALNSTAIGVQDVTAIAVCIAVIDPKSKVLVSNDQLTVLAGSMNDFAPGMKPGDLLGQWQGALDASALPKPAVSSIRLYERYFRLAAKP